MFSGIVEGVREVVEVRRRGPNRVISIDMGRLASGVRLGDSVAINGACLTVIRKRGSRLYFEAMEETMSRTNLGELKVGDKVNIERPLRLSDRLGGHLVTGHIDGIGIIEDREDYEGSSKIWVSVPKDVMSLIIPKGSVALDGISLTVVDVLKESFSVCLIPHTLKLTTLGWKGRGSRLNIEADMIGKYILKLLDEMGIKELLKGRG